MKNIFEKKEMTHKIIWVICLFPIVMIGIYKWMKVFEPEEVDTSFWLWIFATVSINGWAVWIFGMYLDLKIPKIQKPEWFLEELKEVERLFSEKRQRFLNCELDRKERNNKTCPSCGNHGENVQKIREVNGIVSGTFSLGFGDVNGEINTGPINHCSKCGNEWKRYEIASYSKEAMTELLNPMYYFFKEGKDSLPDPLKKISAKVLRVFLKEHNSYSLWGYEAEKLSSLSVREIKKYTGR